MLPSLLTAIDAIPLLFPSPITLDKFHVPASGSSEQRTEASPKACHGERRTLVRLFVRVTFSTVSWHVGVTGISLPEPCELLRT